MFEVGQVVVSKTSGVCIIRDKVMHDFGMGEQEYFILEQYYHEGLASSKIFIASSKADIQLRKLIDKKTIDNAIKTMVNSERLWFTDTKERRMKFEEMYKSGQTDQICILYKSLYLQNEVLKENKKTLSMMDKSFLDKIQKDLSDEMSVVLGIAKDKVASYLIDKIEEKNGLLQ